jgi:hypothetical protein
MAKRLSRHPLRPAFLERSLFLPHRPRPDGLRVISRPIQLNHLLPFFATDGLQNCAALAERPSASDWNSGERQNQGVHGKSQNNGQTMTTEDEWPDTQIEMVIGI